MDPLSITVSVITLLQATNSALSLCYAIRTGLRKVPWPLIRLIEEIQDLRNITEAIFSATEDVEVADDDVDGESGQTKDLDGLSRSISGPLASCLEEIAALETKLRPMLTEDILNSQRKAVAHAIVWKFKEAEVKTCLSRLERCKSALNLAITSQNSLSLQKIEKITTSIKNSVATSNSRLEQIVGLMSKSQLDDRGREISRWLSELDSGQSHRTALKLHQHGTGQWLMESSEFAKWVQGRHRLLWLTGPPGAGKTVLFANVVENLEKWLVESDLKALFAYTYCDFRNTATAQSSTSILGSLLSQLCRQVGEFPGAVLAAFENRKGPSSTELPSAELIIAAIAEISQRWHLFLLIDALDESSEGPQLAQLLVTLLDSSSDINILLTSRNNLELQQTLATASCSNLDLQDKAKEVAVDVDMYTAGRLKTDSRLEWLNSETRNHISRSLHEKGHGMFRWVQCQLDDIAQARTIRDIKRALETLPQGLDETYSRILLRVPQADVPLLHKVLTWLSFSLFQLTLEEVWEAVAIEPGSDCIDDECRLRSPQEILALGNSLISVSADGFVRLAHLSVRDYLLSDTICRDARLSGFAIKPTEAHRQLAMDCLTYLTFRSLCSGPEETQTGYLSRLASLPLLKYAARAWTYHLRGSRHDRRLQGMAIHLFSPENRPEFLSWVQLINADFDFKWNVYPRHATTLYYAASFGLTEVVRYLLTDKTTQLDEPGSRFGGTAVHAATIRRHRDIMTLLLDAGASASQADYNGVTPLHSAASKGNLEEARLLLKHGAPTGAKDQMRGETPMDWAQLSGQADMVRLLEGEGATLSLPAVEKVRVVHSPGVNTPAGPSNCDPGSKTGQPAVWRPQPGYFPDIYERRSGLASSVIVSLEVGGSTKPLDVDYMAAVGLVPGHLESPIRSHGRSNPDHHVPRRSDGGTTPKE